MFALAVGVLAWCGKVVFRSIGVVLCCVVLCCVKWCEASFLGLFGFFSMLLQMVLGRWMLRVVVRGKMLS